MTLHWEEIELLKKAMKEAAKEVLKEMYTSAVDQGSCLVCLRPKECPYTLIATCNCKEKECSPAKKKT